MYFFHNYSQIKKLKGAGFRGRIRNIALDSLSLLQKFEHNENSEKKPRVQFVYFHHVFQDEEAKLSQLLKNLSRQYSFISYSEGVDRILQKRIDKPYLCFSFDDGFKNNLAAAAIMEPYGISACFFVNPGIVGETDFSKIEKHCRQRLNFPPVEFMNWKDIESLIKSGHEIGSHTMNHINVSNTGLAEFEEDCIETYNILSSKCGTVKHFAYPYGRFFHFNEGARKIVFRTGYVSCASAERGCHVVDDNTFESEKLLIRRDHIILDWKQSHIQYFLTKNARNASSLSNYYPTDQS